MAPRFRALKGRFRAWLADDAWQAHLPAMLELPPSLSASALMALLPQGEPLTSRAAHVLGVCVARLADARLEDGRVFMRRFMWHMNDESGNIGWGVPEAFAACLVAHAGLAAEFHRMLIAYIRQTGRADMYCDHAVLRRSCVEAVGRLASAYPCYRTLACEALYAVREHDVDALCRERAAALLVTLCA